MSARIRALNGNPEWGVQRWEVVATDGNGPITHAICDTFGNIVQAPYNSYRLAVFCRDHTRWYVETTTFRDDKLVGTTGPFGTPEEAVSVMLLMQTER
jgi:hypothetical protein